MTIPVYKDLRKERHQKQIVSLKKASVNNAKISKSMHNYENGIELDLEGKDDRSNYEKLEDKNNIRQTIGQKVYKLFNNDPDEAETFIDYIMDNKISITEFNKVYPILLKDSDPMTNTVSYMIPTFARLIDNDFSTGSVNTSSIIRDIYNMIERIYDRGGISETKADDLVDKSEAIKSNTDLTIIQKIMNQPGKTDQQKIIEFDKLTRFYTPEKQKLNSDIKKKRGRPKGSINKPKSNIIEDI